MRIVRPGLSLRRHRDRVNAVLLTLVSFGAYAATAAPSVATVFDDSLEFQVVLPTLGIAHPSGYPLYTLLGKLFTILLPLRDAAHEINLLSALCAALAVGVLYLVARNLAGGSAAAATAVAVFAISPTWWEQSTLAEVYALHGLLVALFLYFLLRWEETRLTGRSDRYLQLAALTGGLGLTHHRMIALLLPAALVFVFWTDPGLLRQPRRWFAPIFWGLAPLLLYLYLPLRGQWVTSLDGSYAPTWRGTLDWVLARGYNVFITGNPFNIARGFGDYLGLFLHELGVLILVAASLGAWQAWRFSQRRTVFLALATAAQIAFSAVYKVQDFEVFFLPAFMLVTLWAAWGLAPLFDGFTLRARHAIRAARLPARLRAPVLALWLIAVACVILFEPARGLLTTLPTRDRSGAWAVYDQGRDMIVQAAPQGRVIGLLGETTLVRYFRDVAGMNPRVNVTAADGEAERFAALETALAAGEQPYLTRDLPGAAQRYSLDAAGALIAVRPKAAPASVAAGVDMGAGVRLTHASVHGLDRLGEPALRVMLTWTATRPLSESLKVSARALAADGRQLAAVDATPVHFAYPTTAWIPGEAVDDVYDLPAAGAAQILIILYRETDGAELGRFLLATVAGF